MAMKTPIYIGISLPIRFLNKNQQIKTKFCGKILGLIDSGLVKTWHELDI